jgi:hypothetical protein
MNNINVLKSFGLLTTISINRNLNESVIKYFENSIYEFSLELTFM